MDVTLIGFQNFTPQRGNITFLFTGRTSVRYFMNRYKEHRQRVSIFLAAALTGGTLLGTCEMRLREAIILGSQAVISQALDPNNFFPETSGNGPTDDGSGDASG